jgi:hypothetical protein
MERTFNDDIKWMGTVFNPNLVKKGLATKKIKLLSHSYRMPKKILRDIKDSHIIPAQDFPQSSNVEGTGVTKQDITVTQTDPGDEISKVLATKIYESTVQRGIHPGHIAVLYPDEAATALFPGGLTGFIHLVNAELASRVAVGRHAPQLSDNMEDGLLYRPQPAGQRPMASDGTIDVRDSAQYWCDRHQEVVPTKLVDTQS